MSGFNIFRMLRGTVPVGTRWNFCRTIKNRKYPQLSGKVVAGVARFTPVPDKSDTLQYDEDGEYEPDSAAPGKPPIKIKQALLYQHALAGIRVCSLEDVGKYKELYNLTMPDPVDNRVTARDTHVCHPDTYKVTYDFPDPERCERFTVVQEVSGPKKDFTSTTTFCRIS